MIHGSVENPTLSGTQKNVFINARRSLLVQGVSMILFTAVIYIKSKHHNNKNQGTALQANRPSSLL